MTPQNGPKLEGIGLNFCIFPYQNFPAGRLAVFEKSAKKLLSAQKDVPCVFERKLKFYVISLPFLKSIFLQKIRDFTSFSGKKCKKSQFFTYLP